MSKTPKNTVTIAHIKPSQTSLAVAWQRLSRADVPLPQVPDLSTASATRFSFLATELLTDSTSNSKSQSYVNDRRSVGQFLFV
jgi:hypothetical protein